jgi:hypothetical protein
VAHDGQRPTRRQLAEQWGWVRSRRPLMTRRALLLDPERQRGDRLRSMWPSSSIPVRSWRTPPSSAEAP